MTDILMPKATAVWLIDNTGLSFEQIAAFCGLHHLEVKGIADGDVAAGVRGADPIATGQLTREEIAAAEADPAYRMNSREPKHAEMLDRKRKGPRYTPLSRRQERPNAIAWLVKNHPEVSDAQIAKLIGTTKATIESVRKREHWNSANIQPQDPVALGLSSQLELDEVVRKAAEKKRKEAIARGEPEEGEPLKPVEEAAPEEEEAPAGRFDPADVFSKFKPAGETADEDEAEPDASATFQDDDEDEDADYPGRR